MRRLVLAAVVAAGLFGTAPVAQACQLQHCSWAQPVCDAVGCNPMFCVQQPFAGQRCFF